LEQIDTTLPLGREDPRLANFHVIIFWKNSKLRDQVTTTLQTDRRTIYTLRVKKLCHFYFYCNFGKCWSIFKILSMSESERNGS